MDTKEIFEIFKTKFPDFKNPKFYELMEKEAEILLLEKKDCLVKYQTENLKIFFIIKGSFIRNVITSRGEEKTIMFHTENFTDIFKSYDAVYFHSKTDYQIIANENSIVLSVDFENLFSLISKDLEYLLFYIKKTEELFLNSELFRKFQLSLTSEEYLDWLYSHYSFLFQRFPAQNIASFMGITPVWLSKLRAKFIS